MKFLRRHPLIVTTIVTFGVFIALLRLSAWMAGPARCRDGWASPSIGERGACSWHGGVKRDGGLGIFVFIITGFAGWLTFGVLTEEPPKPVPDPSKWRLCPKCRSKMHHDPEHPNLLRCDCEECDGLSDHRPVPPSPYSASPPRDLPPLVPPQVDDGESCPKCGAGMRLRKARHGYNRGKHFYGCSLYPHCTGIRPIKKSRR